MARLLCDRSVLDEVSKPIDQEKFGSSIVSGFLTTGLFPVNASKPQEKLPPDPENFNYDTPVQREFLKKLDTIRHNPPRNKQPARPRKEDKLPAGSSYTCRPVPVRRQT